MQETQSLGSAVVDVIRQLSEKKNDAVLPLHEPEFSGNEWLYVKECLDTGWVSSAGRFVDRLEGELASFTNSAHAVAVVNGTAALHIALLLSGVKPDDEVIVPSLSFVATANAIMYCQATPHFVDVSSTNLGLDAVRLNDYLEEISKIGTDGKLYNRISGKRISAIVPMHTFGHPVDMDAVLEVAERFNLIVIEDAAESLGSYYKGKSTGTFGLFGIVSFNGNKIMTTGGGGAILTQSKELAAMAKHVTTTAKLPHKWSFDHDIVGYNYRMPNINAALGCAQLELVPGFLARKRLLAEKYSKGFQEIKGLSFLEEPAYASSNYWLNAIILDDEDVLARDEILRITNEAGILTRPVWTPLHQLPMYSNCPRMDLPITESLHNKIINLPSGPSIVG
ncbi:LegC family aminotransferase [Paenibacillus sp. CF384]|uniref:LegC family aminotransferase n=1 Tax=Paenibacillus sp. CF384 TaxID=1884382 RepID=UPI00089D49D6|nr:LegC family aminotransferase [Paenibacillus sp. CF384]SDX28603.1 perosamine synthetase [Paenibacillus sp. CF384]